VTPPTSQDGRQPATVQFPPRLSTQPSRLSGATRRMSHQNLRGSSRRTTLSEGSTLINKSSGVGAARMTSEAFHKPEPSWPAQPVFEDQGPYPPEHIERYGSRSNLVQGTEQSNRFLHPAGLWDKPSQEWVLVVQEMWMTLRVSVSHPSSGWVGPPTSGPTRESLGHRCEIRTGKTSNHQDRVAEPSPGRQARRPKRRDPEHTAFQLRERSCSWRS
jgi:hypothetical protein